MTARKPKTQAAKVVTLSPSLTLIDAGRGGWYLLRGTREAFHLTEPEVRAAICSHKEDAD